MIVVPAELAGYHEKFYGARGRAWSAALPGLVGRYLDRWELRLDGAPWHGMVALVLPVRRADGSRAALKLQPLDEEHLGEGSALRAWAGDGAVRLLDEDPVTGTLLLERLDPDRSLETIPDDGAALQILAELLARLTARPAPDGIRPLADVAGRMLTQAPQAATRLTDRADRTLLVSCAAAVTEVLPEPGDRLLHWDLHYANVLAGDREPWLAIDPKPLAGDPGFDLLPALHNRWDDVAATGDIARTVHRRFDLMVDILALDRARAVAWTLGRVLQNGLWDIEDGGHALDPAQVAIAGALLARRG